MAIGIRIATAQTGMVSPESAATVKLATGQVSVLRDSVPWTLNAGDSVRLQQLIVTGPDGFAVFEVSDGSTFEVYPNSRVTFRNNPGNWRDLLDVWLGRVKIHIQRMTGNPHPNRIHTPTAVISVRGTEFVVEVEDDEATTMVLVERGQVAVQHALMPRGAPKVLNEGEWIRVYKQQPLAAKTVDRESVIRGLWRVISDALYTAATRAPSSGGGAPGGGGGSLPGDTEPPPPPPPPPSGPPPPPPGA
jgi:ferric-dicitrate binding protein FerR (iron transport regulator)